MLSGLMLLCVGLAQAAGFDTADGNVPVKGRKLVWTRCGDDGVTTNGVATSDEPLEIKTKTDKPAFFVWANVNGVKGEFDDDSFTLLPGCPKTLHFTPKQSVKPDEFKMALSVTHLRCSCVNNTKKQNKTE